MTKRCDGNIREFISARGWETRATITLFKQVAVALSILHSKGIVHRNLKLENILVDSSLGSPLAKVSDWSIPHLLDVEPPFRIVAPEYFEEAELTPASDVWTFGMLLWSCLSGGSEPYGEIGTRIAVGCSTRGDLMTGR